MQVTINGETVEVADSKGAAEFVERKLREQQRQPLRFIEAVNEAIDLLTNELEKQQRVMQTRAGRSEERAARIQRLRDVIEGLQQ